MASQLRWTSKSVDLLRTEATGVSRGPGGEKDGSEDDATHYAGRRRILKPAANRAHWAKEGYFCPMVACLGKQGDCENVRDRATGDVTGSAMWRLELGVSRFG